MNRSWPMARLMLAAVLAAGLMLVGAGCEDDVEEALGEASAASIEAAYDVDHDPLMNEWLNHAGQTIVAQSRRQTIPYEFKVIETDLVNAFAAPYGHIYLTRGFMDFCESEDEVWMVLAHEVGHVVHRDSIKSFKQSLLMGILTQVIKGESRTVGDVVGIGLGLLSLRYSRDDEYEADDAGTLLCYRAGYDPHKGLDFYHRLMTKLQKHRPSRFEVYFMTHPRTDDRIKRQLKREELSTEDAEVLMRIARGYMTRGQPARAAQMLREALTVAPESAALHSLLGDAYAARGELGLARAHYKTAREQEPDSRYVRARLAALDDAPMPATEGVGPPGRQKAGELLAELSEVRALSESSRASATRYAQKTREQIGDLVSTVKGINERLLDLADYEGDVTEATQELLVRGNAAISRATEPIYVLEAVNEGLEDMGAEIGGLLTKCEGRLEAARAGEGNPEDIPALQTAVRELRRGSATLELAMAEAPNTVGDVRAAQSSARGVASLMERMVREDDPESLAADQLRNAASHTQKLGSDALQAVNRARRQSVKARSHALLARLNLLGTQATPYEQRLFDRQIAHLLLVPEAQVRAVRAAGAGYGETAMSIAAAKSLRADPGQHMPTVAAGVSPVGSAMEQGAAIANANVLMKFLADRMQSERDAAEAM
ncbi:MAG: M48 family metalloprotease [Armatimonadota bacterium]|nr:M48 family metalloprotease [Armatimonadota bacterium]